jgi:FixJ family two-component response regulator
MPRPVALRGRPRHDDLLTPAEWRVAEAVRHGLTNPEIARLQGVSMDAVKYHVAPFGTFERLGNGTARCWISSVEFPSVSHMIHRHADGAESPAYAGARRVLMRALAQTQITELLVGWVG